MITFLYGPYGSGKTTAILREIADRTARGLHTFLIVPEQEAVQAERMTLNALPPSAGLCLEVLNFSRLYNRVCREYGGLSYRYIKPSIRHLLMWQNLRELAPLLEEYGELAQKDPSLGEIMLSAISECKACGVRPHELERAASAMSKDDPLYRKLRDLSLIYASFDRLVSERYTDSADDLSRLADMLDTHDFFGGTHVFIDSFSSFTAQEHRILRRILATAEEVTVSIPLPSPTADGIYTKSIVSSLKKLKRSAEACSEVREVVLPNNHRAATPALAYLAENLWRLDAVKAEFVEDPNGSIVIEKCANPYAEADAIAAHVLSLLRRGERCRDMVVILRDPERYRGILEPAFEKNGIPLFLSEKTDLCNLAPIKLILTALRIRKYHWQKHDVIAHLKTGLCDISPRAADLLEDYINTWDLSGAAFLEGDWSMNPDGFSGVLTSRGQEILSVANEARRALTEPLMRFFILLEAAETMPELCRAVYTYLCEISLEDKLSALAAKESERGQKKAAKELSLLYGVILETLADMAEAIPDAEIDGNDFDTILQLVFSETDIGTIPTSVDEVTVGSAATLRVSSPKYAFVAGLCEGEFPAAVHDTGLLGDRERKALEALGIELSADADTRSSDERMYLLRAFCAPSHGLYLFVPEAELSGKAKLPSLALLRVSKLFPNLTIHRYDGADLSYLHGAPRSMAAHLRELSGTPEGSALQEALLPYLPNLPRYATARSHAPEASLDTETAQALMGQTMTLSFSRFESFVKCPFGYYCTYVLGLREGKRAKFRPQDMGTFVHEILEKLLGYALTERPDGSFPDRDDLDRRTEEIVGEYLDRILPTREKASGRLRHLCARLKKLSVLILQNLIEEFSHSQFRPAFFELSLDGKDGNPPPIVFVSDDESFRVLFRGVIDRVDLMKKDGEVYVRVVDYKTGTKDFRTEDLRHGINTQMLLYLYSLCLSQNGSFAKYVGLAEGQAPHPAGMVYLSTNIPVIEAEAYESEEAVREEAVQHLKRSGLLIDDKEILAAMNDSLSPAFLLSASKDRSGALTDKNLVSSERFDALFADIRKTVLEIAAHMRRGCADAAPLHYGDIDPCAYCSARAICRKISD